MTGTGDYNGDGRADVLLHNDNGADVVWEANGSTLAGSVYLGNPGANYAGAVAGRGPERGWQLGPRGAEQRGRQRWWATR